MATLTTTQRSDMQGDLGIGSDETVFTNAELDRLYTRAGGDYETAILLALRQLLASTARLHDYSVAQNTQNMSQVFKNLQQLLGYYESRVAKAPTQVKIVGARPIPPRWKDEPQ